MGMHFKRGLLCKSGAVRQTSTGEELRNTVRRSTEERRRDGGRDHYLSAPGGESATFGRGGGAGGFELNHRTKTKEKKKGNNKKKKGTRNKTDRNEQQKHKRGKQTRQHNHSKISHLCSVNLQDDETAKWIQRCQIKCDKHAPHRHVNMFHFFFFYLSLC